LVKIIFAKQILKNNFQGLRLVSMFDTLTLKSILTFCILFLEQIIIYPPMVWLKFKLSICGLKFDILPTWSYLPMIWNHMM